MKKRSVIIAFIAIAIACTACHRQTCIIPYVVFELRSADATDSLLNFVQFRKGSRFTDSVGAFFGAPLYQGPGSIKMMLFPKPYNESFAQYDFDWRVTLLPSGRVYEIKELTHGAGNRSLGFGIVKDQCVNVVSCTVNEVSYHTNGGQIDKGNSANAFIEIP